MHLAILGGRSCWMVYLSVYKTDKFKLYVFFPLMHAISTLMFFRECHILGNVGNEEDIDGQVQIQV